MKSNHTPGPWSLYGDRPVHICSMSVAAPTIATVNIDNSLPNYEETEANARLIAAAPDLLAALENIVQNFDMGDFIITVAAQGEDTPEHRANLDFARAAIAKATDPQ